MSGGGGSKLLNDPVDRGQELYTTTNLGLNESNGITIQEDGLYFCNMRFLWNSGEIIDSSEKAQFQLKVNGIIKAINNAKANGTMCVVTLTDIFYAQAGQKVTGYIHTSVAEAKFYIQYTLTKLRGDEDA